VFPKALGLVLKQLAIVGAPGSCDLFAPNSIRGEGHAYFVLMKKERPVHTAGSAVRRSRLLILSI
jgi:hypothetical protein